MMQKKKLSFSLPAFLLVVSLLVLIFSIFGDKGWIEYQILITEEEKVDAEIQKLRNEHLILAEKIRSLQKDTNYYENLAREKLNFLKKNERMIELEYHR